MPCIAAAEETKAPLSLDEILEKRRSIRQELMVPSLEGIRGVAYRVVGYKSFEPLEKSMGDKLVHLGVPVVRLLDMKEGQKPVDAIVQITFFKAGNFNIGELTAVQWVSLLRNPKIKVRAVTYKDRMVLQHGKPLPAVESLTNQFVIDFLKANQKPASSEAVKPGIDDTVTEGKDKSKGKKSEKTEKKLKEKNTKKDKKK